MKTLLFAIFIVMTVGFTIAGPEKTSIDRMPSKFDRFDSTMVIHLYHGGGKAYESEDVYIRFDSCIRIDMKQGVDKITKFAMTKEMRDKVLNSIITNNAEYIRQKEKSGFAHDKATTSICFEWNGKKDFCVMSSASTEIAEKSAIDFRKLWNELQEFSKDEENSRE